MQVAPGFTLSIDIPMLVVVGIAIALDIVTGLIKAGVTGTMTSSAMREGLIHKATYVIVLLVACFCEIACQEFDLGVQIPSASAVCVYVILTELVSIAENIVVANPDIAEWPIIKILANANSKK